MLTLKQLLAYCSRNGYNSIIINDDFFNEPWFDFSVRQPSDIAVGHTTFLSQAFGITEAYNYCAKYDILDNLLNDMRFTMRLKCKKLAHFRDDDVNDDDIELFELPF